MVPKVLLTLPFRPENIRTREVLAGPRCQGCSTLKLLPCLSLRQVTHQLPFPLALAQDLCTLPLSQAPCKALADTAAAGSLKSLPPEEGQRNSARRLRVGPV